MVVAQPCLHRGADDGWIVLLWGLQRHGWMREGRAGGAGVADELVELWVRAGTLQSCSCLYPCREEAEEQCRAAGCRYFCSETPG